MQVRALFYHRPRCRREARTLPPLGRACAPAARPRPDANAEAVRGGWQRRRGFALALVVTLLGLLVLTVYALSVLARVGSQIAVTGGHRVQARANAMLALRSGLGELQRLAGPDARITAMAGVTGVPAGGNRTTRHWCGVWRSDGSFAGWLVSGAEEAANAALRPGVTAIEMVASGSVGASDDESEHVVAGLLPIDVPQVAGVGEREATVGAYAYVVLDEGVKISARVPAVLLEPGALPPVLASKSSTSAQAKLRAALDAHAQRLNEMICYEQLRLLPAPATLLTPSTLQDNFHHVTLTTLSVAGSSLRAGAINLNTTSAHVWRSVVATYNTSPDAEPLGNADVIAIGTALAEEFADCSSGKAAFGPFGSVDAFGGSALLARNLPKPVTPAEFMAAIGPSLAVRSDTFRIRGYGEARNPARAGAVEAVAWCEAIVQRALAPANGGLGRRFAITYFRWLGPEDI